jgi:DNA anti-recombination protein RmuC
MVEEAYARNIMAKIVQTLTRASQEYQADTAQSLVRDLDAVLEKLNTTFQEELKQEIEARSFFLD